MAHYKYLSLLFLIFLPWKWPYCHDFRAAPMKHTAAWLEPTLYRSDTPGLESGVLINSIGHNWFKKNSWHVSWTFESFQIQIQNVSVVHISKQSCKHLPEWNSPTGTDRIVLFLPCKDKASSNLRWWQITQWRQHKAVATMSPVFCSQTQLL